MIGSMTGYGRAEAVLHSRKITVEVRSVNNRYLDCGIKMPRVYIFAEEALKKCVKAAITRGKVDVFVSIDETGLEQSNVRLNKAAADGYYAALCQLRDSYQLQDDISVSLLARFTDVFVVEKNAEDAQVVAEDIAIVLNRALEDFNAMRRKEGEKLQEDILCRAETIEKLVSQVEQRSPQTLEAYRERLTLKMQEVLAEKQIDDSRILAEAAIYADKIAVDEETVRLRSHLAQLREMLLAGGAVGRKLDFLIQEFNRESNTIGSKCNDLDISRWVVDLKAEIEKIREQVQNIE